MYKVLYRKWRPRTFDEVVGQPNIVSVLKKQVSSGRVPHAFMFCGMRGTGKTSCAKIFAKAINCLNSHDGNPCLECEICKKMEESAILDICEIDAASNNGVDNVRAIIENTNLAPSEVRYKVYIIDEFHMLSVGAFNAFLRTLEEPHENVVFILATTECHKIPRTIISRCQRFDFRKISPEFIGKRLKFVCENEKINISDEVIEMISRNSEGSVRDALSILDQCSNSGKRVDESIVNDVLGLSDSESIEGIVENLFNCNLKESLLLLNCLDEKGRSITYLCDMIMSFVHDLFCYKSTNIFFGSCNFSHDKISKISHKFSLDVFLKCFDILKDSSIKMPKVLSKKYELEEAIIKVFCVISDKRSDNNDSSSFKKNYAIEKDDLPNSDGTLECWGEIVKKISKVSSSLSSMLTGSRAYIRGDNLMIDTNDLVFDMMKKSIDDIYQIIRDVTNKDYKICKFSEGNSEKKESQDIVSLINKASSVGLQMTIN